MGSQLPPARLPGWSRCLRRTLGKAMWIAIPAWYQPLGVVSSPARGHTKLGSAQVKEPRFATKQSSPPSGCARKHSQAVKPNEWVCKTDLGDMAKPPAHLVVMWRLRRAQPSSTASLMERGVVGAAEGDPSEAVGRHSSSPTLAARSARSTSGSPVSAGPVTYIPPAPTGPLRGEASQGPPGLFSVPDGPALAPVRGRGGVGKRQGGKGRTGWRGRSGLGRRG